MNVILFGQKHFACQVAGLIRSRPGWHLRAVSAPPGDRLRREANYPGTSILDSARNLNAADLHKACGGTAPPSGGKPSPPSACSPPNRTMHQTPDYRRR